VEPNEWGDLVNMGRLLVEDQNSKDQKSLEYAKVLLGSCLARIDKSKHSNFVREVNDFLKNKRKY